MSLEKTSQNRTQHIDVFDSKDVTFRIVLDPILFKNFGCDGLEAPDDIVWMDKAQTLVKYKASGVENNVMIAARKDIFVAVNLHFPRN